MDKRHFVSLRVKITIGVILICLGISALAVLSMRQIAGTMIDKEYGDKAEQISKAVATTLDPKEVHAIRDTVLNIYKSIPENKVVTSEGWGSEEWNEYMAHYVGIDQTPTFLKLRDQLRSYQDIYGVNCIYLVYYKTSIRLSLYLVDAAYEGDCPPGVYDNFEDGIWPGEEDITIPASMTNEDVYGWLVTGGHAITDGDEIVAYVCTDISMNDVKAKEKEYVYMTAGAMAILSLIMLILFLLYSQKYIIRPVVMLSDTARNYCSENNDVIHHDFEKLEIRTKDEIADLLSSMKQMEQDMNTNINNLIETKLTLKETEDKANKLSELARKDALTGIRNKTAYDYEVELLEKDLAEGSYEFGLAMIDLNFLKKINDTYGHEKGNVAIIRLCRLVCEIFDHSPVFRVGGDEFVVVLMGHDYSVVDELVAEFYKRLAQYEADESLEPWEKISAAVGYAKFNRSCDTCVEDVFKKADKAMYAKKIAMKAQRTD